MATAPGIDAAHDYRPVSRLAVGALGAGCASSLVLLTPLAAMVPIVAIAIAVVALADIRRSEGRIVGRWLALAGLGLAVGFASQAATTTLTGALIARQRATATATAWLDAVHEGRWADAIAVSGPRALPPTGEDRGGPPAGPEATSTAFQAMPTVKAVVACPTGAPAIASAARTDDGWLIRIPLDDCGSRSTLLIAVAPRVATRRGKVVEEWLVNAVTLDP